MPLNVNGLLLAESYRTSYRITLSPDDKPEDLLSPEWWKHVSKQLIAGDRVEIHGYDRQWFAEAIVTKVGVKGNGGACVAYIIGPINLAEAGEEIIDHTVTWAGPVAKWRIARSKDKEIVKDGFISREAALAWLNEKAMAVAA